MTPTGKLHSLVYTSSATERVDMYGYKNIADTSIAYNKSASVTGLLLVHNGLIMQILEGPETTVEDLYSRIQVDRRHIDPTVLVRHNLERREFPNWSMGFQCDAAMAMAPIFKLSAASLKIAIRQPLSTISQTLITSFSRSSGLSLA